MGIKEKFENNPYFVIISACVTTGSIVAVIVIWVFSQLAAVQKEKCEISNLNNQKQIRDLNTKISVLEKKNKMLAEKIKTDITDKPTEYSADEFLNLKEQNIKLSKNINRLKMNADQWNKDKEYVEEVILKSLYDKFWFQPRTESWNEFTAEFINSVNANHNRIDPKTHAVLKYIHKTVNDDFEAYPAVERWQDAKRQIETMLRLVSFTINKYKIQ
ncbi:MAG: hypothetical protein GY795_28230 [Desulfobacterales bacterium]|nr:hypothetical protein [Desulfobacterales bacterium]